MVCCYVWGVFWSLVVRQDVLDYQSIYLDWTWCRYVEELVLHLHRLAAVVAEGVVEESSFQLVPQWSAEAAICHRAVELGCSVNAAFAVGMEDYDSQSIDAPAANFLEPDRLCTVFQRVRLATIWDLRPLALAFYSIDLVRC